MNNVLLQLSLTHYLNDKVQADVPDLTATIVKVNGPNITLNVATGADNLYCGGTLYFVDSPFGLRTTIAESNYMTVTLTSKLVGKFVPKVGDVVKLSKGPLGMAEVYMMEPPTVADDDKPGKTFNVIVKLTDEGLDTDSLSQNKPADRWYSATKEQGMAIIVESPNWAPTTNPQVTINQTFDLLTLTEQVKFLTYLFRMDPVNSIHGSTPITTVYALSERTGQKKPRRSSITEFTWTSR